MVSEGGPIVGWVSIRWGDKVTCISIARCFRQYLCSFREDLKNLEDSNNLEIMKILSSYKML